MVSEHEGPDPEPIQSDPPPTPAVTAPSEPAAVVPEGRLVAGRYRLLSRLGTGGMGTVWRAEDEVLGREVAVKEVTFPPGLSDADREVMRERTRREARAAARLDHPSAVTVFDVVEQDGSPFLVMELVQARTLSQQVREQGPLSVQRTAQVGLALLGALETAHRRKILHRDVKPGNVLLGPPSGDDPGRVVLTDFGLASTAGDVSITGTGMLLGSPAFIAPERARGQAPGPESDLWSLGATLFAAVEGRAPYDGGGDPLRTVTAVVTGQHAPFTLAGALAPVLSGLLEREPAQRLDAPAARRALLPLAGTPAQAGAAAQGLPVPAAETNAAQSGGVPGSELDRDTTELPVLALRDSLAAAAAGTAGQGTAPATRDRASLPPAPPDPGPRHARPDPPRARDSPAPARLPRLPEPVRQRPRRSPVPLLLLLAVLAVGTGLGTYVLTRTPPATTRFAGEDASPAAGRPSPTAALDTSLPTGWTLYTDQAEGWSVGVPPGYARSDRRDQVQFRNDADRRSLRIEAGTAEGTAVARWRSFSQALRGSLADYTQLSLEPVEFRDYDAADLAFTYTDQTALRVLDRGFVVPREGAADAWYGLYWQTNDSDWDAAGSVFTELVRTFRPAA